MTTEELSQLPWMIKERNYQTQQIQELQAMLQPGRKKSCTFFGSELNRYEQKVLANDDDLRSRAENIAKEALEKRLDQIEKLYHFIYQVPDSQMRLILLARFVDGKTWQGVATAIGESDESYVRKKCKKFLKDYKEEG